MKRFQMRLTPPSGGNKVLNALLAVVAPIIVIGLVVLAGVLGFVVLGVAAAILLIAVIVIRIRMALLKRRWRKEGRPEPKTLFEAMLRQQEEAQQRQSKTTSEQPPGDTIDGEYTVISREKDAD